jgi:hypothetical protein
MEQGIPVKPKKSKLLLYAGIAFAVAVIIVIIIIVVASRGGDTQQPPQQPPPQQPPPQQPPTQQPPTQPPPTAPAPSPTPSELCNNEGGVLLSNGTCMTQQLCQSKGGTWYKSECYLVRPQPGEDAYDCECIGMLAKEGRYHEGDWCGNNAVGGSIGDKIYNIRAEYAESTYNPCGTGTNLTGWTCTNKASGADICTQ